MSYMVALLDCGVGSKKTKLVVGYPVTGREIGSIVQRIDFSSSFVMIGNKLIGR